MSIHWKNPSPFWIAHWIVCLSTAQTIIYHRQYDGDTDDEDQCERNGDIYFRGGRVNLRDKESDMGCWEEEIGCAEEESSE
jgi:hypothetical protein